MNPQAKQLTWRSPASPSYFVPFYIPIARFFTINFSFLRPFFFFFFRFGFPYFLLLFISSFCYFHTFSSVLSRSLRLSFEVSDIYVAAGTTFV
jgi:hypothetical protein